MALSLQQTDTNGGAPTNTDNACTTLTGTDLYPQSTEIKVGGTAGTVARAVTCPASTTGKALVLACPAETAWSIDQGTWTIRLNVTTAASTVTLPGVWICLWDRGSGAYITIASNPSLNLSMSTTGVKTITLQGNALDPAAITGLCNGTYAQFIYVIFSQTNSSSMTTSSFSYTPNQLVDAPITVLTQTWLDVQQTDVAGAMTNYPWCFSGGVWLTPANSRLLVDGGTAGTATYSQTILAGNSTLKAVFAWLWPIPGNCILKNGIISVRIRITTANTPFTGISVQVYLLDSNLNCIDNLGGTGTGSPSPTGTVLLNTGPLSTPFTGPVAYGNYLAFVLLASNSSGSNQTFAFASDQKMSVPFYVWSYPPLVDDEHALRSPMYAGILPR